MVEPVHYRISPTLLNKEVDAMSLNLGNSLWAQLMSRPNPLSSPNRPLLSRLSALSVSIPKPDARDAVLLSEEGKRLSHPMETAPSAIRPEADGKAAPGIETQQAEAAAALPKARNTEIDHYLKRAAARMTAMKDLAKLGQEGYLTSRDRLELDKELTRIQAEMAWDKARTKLILDGRNPDSSGEALFFEMAANHVRKNHGVAAALLERDFERRERGLAPGAFLDNGDGTSTATVLENDLMNHSFVTRITDRTEAMPERLDEWKRSVTAGNNEGHTVVVKHLSYEEFLEKYAVLSLRSAKEAEQSEKLLDEKLGKLAGMTAPLDDAYDKRVDVAARRAEYLRRAAEAEQPGLEPPDPSKNPDAADTLNPDGVTKTRYNPLFKTIEELWRIDELWRAPRDTTFVYIVE